MSGGKIDDHAFYVLQQSVRQGIVPARPGCRYILWKLLINQLSVRWTCEPEQMRLFLEKTGFVIADFLGERIAIGNVIQTTSVVNFGLQRFTKVCSCL